MDSQLLLQHKKTDCTSIVIAVINSVEKICIGLMGSCINYVTSIATLPVTHFCRENFSFLSTNMVLCSLTLFLQKQKLDPSTICA